MGVAMWILWLAAVLPLVMSSTEDLVVSSVVVTEEFPLLMPKVKPSLAETYLCTPIRMDTELTYSIVGFRPNATKMTAHHMLIYGCMEPGNTTFSYMGLIARMLIRQQT